MSDDAAFAAPRLARLARTGVFAACLTLAVTLAAATAVIFPPGLALFVAPLLFLIILVAPKGKAVPRRWALALLFCSAALLPLWPVWLNLKLGPAPILTPPRLLLYALTALWLWDMISSPMRRGQFRLALSRSKWLNGFVFGYFALALLSLPMAEGRSAAAPEFLRQSIIWLLPYCATITYVRRRRDFETVIRLMTVSAVAVASIAIVEALTKSLFVNLMSPFIAGDAEWLRLAQSQKIRDGVFRAQAVHTHPLSLSEHMAMMAPFAFALCAGSRSPRGRLVWGLALAVLLLGALATSSRSALIAVPLVLLLSAAIFAQRTLRRLAASRWRPAAGLATLALLAASPIAAVAAYDLASGKAGGSFANSSQSRVDQMEMALPKIMKRPVGGHGVGRAARVLGYWGRTLTIDNYYLSLALDLGVPGPLCLLGILGAAMASALARSREAVGRNGALYVGVFGCAMLLIFTRAISSQTGNIALMLMIFAAFAGANATLPRRRRLQRASA